MLTRVLELEIRSHEEANRRSKDEHLAKLREVPETGKLRGPQRRGYCRPGIDPPEVEAAADLQPVILGAVAQRRSAADGAPPPSKRYLADDVDHRDHHLRRHRRELTG